MKLRYKFLSAALIILSVLALSEHATASEKEHEEMKQEKKRKPTAWPPQVITEQTIPIGPVHVVNFQQLADSQAAHYTPYHTGFIVQGEDKDAEYKFTPHNIPVGTPTFDPTQLHDHLHQANQPQHQPESPAPTGYFLGTTSNGSEIPPDVDGAAGPVYVLETNNQQYDVYNKTGVLQATLNINTLFSSTGGNGFYDPHVLYDVNYQKYILVSDGFFGANGTNPGGVFVAISETSNPLGNWYTYGINDGDNTQSDLLDYPEVGYNNNWVVITCNNFLANTVPANIYVLDRASLYSGTLGTVKLFTDNNSFSWAPAQTYDLTEDTLWMVQDGNGASGAMQVGSITGTVAAPVYNAGTNIAVTSKWNENAIDVGQKGGGTNELVNDDDTRVGNGSVYINGKLWFTHTIYLPATGTATYSGVDWWQIVPSTLTLKQFGRIADPVGNTNYYYPSLNVNSNGDALVGYCMSGTDSFYPSAAYSFHAAADPVNYMESRYIYKPGTVTYYETLGGNRNRYGDFTGTSVDPNDQSFWNYSEYPVNATTWGIVIAHVGPSVPPTNPPVANFMASDTAFECSGVVQFTDLSTNDPTSWLWNFGDGTTSALQNPSHQYTTNGTFTVILKATNTYGTGTATVASYITISLPAAPTAANVTHCSSSTFSLSASTTNHVAWFDSTGTLLSSSNPFVTPTLNHTTTYWVQDTTATSVDSVGPLTYSTLGAGGFFANTNSHYLTFDALNNFTLISVVVDASTAGTRTIQLINPAGTVIATASPNIPVGISTVTLNFSVPAANGYELALAVGTSDANLYRNNAVTGTVYPFTIANVVSITGNDIGTGYYYYFYNWKVKASGCVSAQTAVSAIIGNGGLTITPNITAVACYGQSTGSVALSTTGGTPNYTYDWNNGQTAATATNLVAGTYLVTVTDAGGCSSTATETVIQPTAALTASATATSASCFGSSNGAVNLTTNGGTTNYTYHWTGGATTANLTGVTAGTYAVTVTDAHSCTATASATVSQPATALTASATATSASCFGSSNGDVNLTAGGGTTNYTYHWTGGATTQNLTGVPAGTYIVTVTDAHSCTATASAIVSQPATALTASATTTGVSCYGSSNGDVNLTASGGTTNYTYHWTGGATTPNLTGVTAGTYTVTVTDANSCTATVSATVSQPTMLTASATATGASCYGSSNGDVNLTASGGTTNYTYHWTGGATTPNLTGVTAGTYTVTVTDANSCTATASATVVQPATALTASATAINASCYGSSNGDVNLTASGGTTSYTYHWTGGATTANLTGVIAGTYTVTVTDAHSCTATASAIVSQPSTALTASATGTSVSCYGSSNGDVNLTASGGTTNYTYHWTGGATTQNLTGVTAGAYTVTVTDANSCTATASATVAQPATALTASATATGVSCYGLSNGDVNLTASGGTTNYTYHWTGGATTQNLTGVTAGAYTVTVTDANSCMATASATVSQPATALTASATATNASCFGSSNGAVNLTAYGGTTNYTYHWTGGATTPDLTGVIAGTYTVTVTDAHSCTATASATVSQPATALTASATATGAGCYGSANGTVNLTAGGGTTNYTYHWTDGATTQNLTGVTAGTYTVTITDANSCTATASATVTEPTAIIATTSATNAACGVSASGSASVSATGGSGSYAYLWSNSQTTDTISNLSGNTYMVTVTDTHSCTATASAIVNNAGSLNITTAPTPVTCYGASNGSASVSETGGTGNISYIWTGGGSTPAISNLSAGTYTVTVSDAAGCTSIATAVVTQPDSISIALVASPATCGTPNGSVNATVTGGTSGYVYHWNTGASTPTISGLSGGPYAVTVTDAHTCTATASTVVSNTGSLSVTATPTPATCYGAANGSALASETGGTGNITYTWTGGGSTPAISNLTAGTYSVTVLDGAGCAGVSSAVVTQPDSISIALVASPATCGTSNGSVNASVTGGTSGYSYHWNTGASTPAIGGLSGGPYAVTVTDANTCTAIASVLVNNTGSLSVTATPTPTTCYGAANGSALAAETGGTGNISYTWTGGGSTPAISNLSAGTYTVTVSDAAGCTGTGTAVVTQPDSISITLIASPATCGTSNGSVNATVTGGTSGYAYHWNTGASTPAIGGLAGGPYSITVTDANTCTAAKAAIVSSNSSLVADLISSNVTCHGASNGSASATVTSGTAPFSYLWNNGVATDIIHSLIAGTYYVTITDSLGCHSYDSVTVNQPTAIVIIVNASQPTCNGQTTGAANLAVTGGIPSYTYAWSNNSTDSTVSGLTPGNYSVTVQDANGCSATSGFNINPVSTISANLIAVADSCFGEQNGEAQASATGGTGTYSYLWNNGDTGPLLNNLAAGNYQVTVTDSHNCIGTASVTVSQPSQLVITTTSVNATNGLSNGSAMIDSVHGGTAPYAVSWSNQQTGNTINNLAPGIYTATVSDANGCQQTANDTIKNITGISDLVNGVDFSIYPNPAKSQVVVNIPDVGSMTEVWLKDILGRVLYIRPIATTKTTIDLGSYANGIYFIEVTEGPNHSTQKLVIDK